MQTLKFDQKVTLQEIITENEQLCTSFVEYLASIHAMEAFEFWIEVELYKRILDEEEATRTAKFIFTTYLSPHSPTEINLEGRLRRELLEKFSKNPNDPHLFNKAQDSVEMMLKYDCLRVFLEVNKGKVRKSTSEAKLQKGTPPAKSEPHALLQRYNSLIKIEKKKVRRESFKKSISGTIRRFTTTSEQPKGIALVPKSSSFNLESRTLSNISEAEELDRKSSEDENSRAVPKRARGKKIRLDPSRKWAMTAGETPDGEEEKDNEDEDKEVDGEAETNSGVTPGEADSRKGANTPNAEWVAVEKPATPTQESGSSVWLVAGSKTEGKEKDEKADVPELEVGAARRKGSGGLFTCFGGGSKKRP